MGPDFETKGTGRHVRKRNRLHRQGTFAGSRIPLLVAAVAMVSISACTMQPASNHAESIRASYQITFAFAAVIFVVVGGAIVYASLRYRRKHGDDALPKQIHGSTKLEITWIAIPTAIVVVLFIVSATVLGKLDSAEANTMTINVQGFQWQWKFTYPQFTDRSGTPLTISGTNGKPTLGLELNKPVHFNLTSDDVIHSFFVPVFLFKRDVIPGHPNQFDLTPNRAGSFAGKCAELCGLKHSTMLFNVKILPPDQFQQWVANQIAIQEHQAWIAANSCAKATDGKVTVVAQSIAFDTKCIQVPAAGTTSLVFDNKDAGVPHNIEIYTDASATTRLAGATGAGDVVTGVASTTYQITGLKPGSYFLRCDVHPTQMTGTFKVTG